MINAYIAIGIITIVILIDQITKIIAKKCFKNKDLKFFKGKIAFTYLENSGMAMGKLSGRYYYFIIVTIIALAVFAFLCSFIDFESKICFSISFSIMIGGTIGNFLDRVLRGYVIDFITANWFKKSLPVFNIADFAIMFGSVCAIIFGILEV